MDLAAVKMDFQYDDWFTKEPNVGYETLLYDAPGRAKWIARVHAVQAGSLELQPTARHSALHIFSH